MQQTLHFIGIGGVGMSALAQAFLDRGCRVTGSDRLLATGQMTPTLATLQAQGVHLCPQDGSGITDATTTVVYSTAIEDDNPDYVKAQNLNIPLLHRSNALAHLSEGHRFIAVSGTCGKSSVTAMLGHLLTVCGKDPTIVNGAEIAGLDNGGTRIGSVRTAVTPGGFFVAEADESDRSLMTLTPTDVIVTNASGDHFPKEEAETLFNAFKAKATGVVIDTRGLEPEHDFTTCGWETHFLWRGHPCCLPMPGAHNVANAKVALEMAAAVGCNEATLATAFSTFRGIRRRLERTGCYNGATVIDDYAHNIEKLAAVWQTLIQVFPKGVCGVWRPHGYAPLRKMCAGLAEMFAQVVRPCDQLLLLPVYDAGGTADRSVNSDALFEQLHHRCPVQLVATLDEAEMALQRFAAPDTALAIFGARDPGLSALAHRLGNTK
ncbi:MAG: hypothetical protein IJV69_00585 [Kiritimatiellae bacterium]|nr:hypothetical protein [Kiritimatiellia bacterium]